MLQSGEGDVALSKRLDRAYYKLTATTARHFQRDGAGWFLTGVAGLDAPTMNRAVVDTADVGDVARFLSEADAFFGERECSWSAVLSTFRPSRGWHSELVARGLHPTTTLDVMVRAPGPLDDAPLDARVRLAGPDEVSAFTDLVMDVFRMPRRFYPALVDLTEAWRAFGARLYVVDDDDGALVATALAAEVDGVAGIYNVATARRARRQGLARAMMRRALHDARAADVVTLQVAPEGFVEAFYVELGFEPLYRWRFYAPRGRIRSASWSG